MEVVAPAADLSFAQLYLIPWAIKIVTALAIFFIGRIVAKWLTGLLEKVLNKSRMDGMLIDFLGNIVYALLLVLVVLAALQQLGVDTTSALAVLGAAGLAVGLALKDSLNNFASGVMLITLRPFKTGDWVEVADVSGAVEAITVFSTTLRSGDNKQVIVPNGQIYDDVIINYSARDTRRIDMVIGIGYDDDIKQAKELLQKLMAEDERIHAEPAPLVAVGELGDNSVNFDVRPWVNTSDYWPVKRDLLERIKLAFDEAGIGIPYPQRDVHLYGLEALRPQDDKPAAEGA